MSYNDKIKYQPIDDQDLAEMDLLDSDVALFMKEKALNST